MSSVAGCLWEMMRGGRVVVGKWINFTFVDLDAHGSAECLATFKLRHDNKHATQGPVSQQRTLKQKQKQKSIKCSSKSKKRHTHECEVHMKQN